MTVSLFRPRIIRLPARKSTIQAPPIFRQTSRMTPIPRFRDRQETYTDNLTIRPSNCYKLLERQVRAELSENLSTFIALGFAGHKRISHPGVARITSVTLFKTLS